MQYQLEIANNVPVNTARRRLTCVMVGIILLLFLCGCSSSQHMATALKIGHGRDYIKNKLLEYFPHLVQGKHSLETNCPMSDRYEVWELGTGELDLLIAFDKNDKAVEFGSIETSEYGFVVTSSGVRKISSNIISESDYLIKEGMELDKVAIILKKRGKYSDIAFSSIPYIFKYSKMDRCFVRVVVWTDERYERVLSIALISEGAKTVLVDKKDFILIDALPIKDLISGRIGNY